MSEHTKGPWWATQTRKQYVDKRLGEWPEVLIQPGTTEANCGNVIATVVMGGPAGTKHDAESVRANARLIAAAPELLEACKEVLNEMRAWNGEEEHYEEGIMFPMFQQLKAVIAKAEGNQ